ncbi:hypothetical protein BGZ65_010632 [Modicella reniformis]|uniref:Arm-like repeat domain-containing protein n=1 Tax=Modicella reniformis TaxID=1440133 RepID=A0A9P6M1X1_9FUNG|nr:hypothetical protein BGZ65_010632 [Modicella reniformis]
MVFGSIVSSPRSSLSPQQLVELANTYLETANNAKDPNVALPRKDPSQTVRGVAIAYIGLGKVLERRGYLSQAQDCYRKAERMGNQHSSKIAMDSNTNTQMHASSSQGQHKRAYDISVLPSNIFAKNVRPPTTFKKLPEPDERLINTPQLTCCLSLLRTSHSLDGTLEPIATKWLLVVENDLDEQERLKLLATDVVRAFKRDELKDAKAVAEVVILSSVLEKDAFRELLIQFYDGISHSDLLNFHQLDGLAQLIQGADPGYLDTDDLVKILNLLSIRLRDTHQQSPRHIYQLTLAASRVLDAMADTKDISDPYLIYQVAYAYQALQCVPDNETLWQGTLRRTGKVIKGVSGLVSAVKGVDLNGFIEGLKDIQKGLAGVTEVVQLVITSCDEVKSLTKSGQGFLESLKEGLSFKRKCAWYAALRGADALIREGEFVSFKKLSLRHCYKNYNRTQMSIIQACLEKDPNSCPLKLPLTTQGSPSLLDRVQNKPDVEGNLRQLWKQRLKERGNAVYIQPQAKSGLQALDDE